jgi:large subunit ribosomal protein L33
MAKKEVRVAVKVKSTESDFVYYTEKSKRNDPARIELRKYDPWLRKHVLFRETK